MTQVSFSPAFEGDEYHSVDLHIRNAGQHEVSEAWAAYLTETFPNRFSLVQKPSTKTEKPAQESKKSKK